MTGSQQTDGRARRWAAHRQQRRAELVDAAVAAIEAAGIDVGFDAIAEQAGVSRTVLYRYFDSRDELQVAVAQRAVELLLAKLTRPLHSGAAPRALITSLVRAHVRWLDEHPELYRLIATRSAAVPAGREAFTAGEKLFAAQLADLLGHYMTLLGVDDDALEPLAYGLIGMVEAAGDWWVRGHERGERGLIGQRRLVDTLGDSIWYVIDGHLRARGVELDPDLPLLSGGDDD
ncbi:putative TetR-family transcriptional regulator [Actinocatenispora thailandica]|uniref:Putative TetR-family transcriptional regulator n=1 Tax=Actinocatenispora thailandica TaxID=227318 RepID=A0A7R7HV66_9ACTN|nr:TetR/AcrR family transcriptional regulator [Actinocatenispora thailandica]BCJ33832.1 putative TetR-family transcriptional regulator [Actinocatenispora thailandica]